MMSAEWNDVHGPGGQFTVDQKRESTAGASHTSLIANLCLAENLGNDIVSHSKKDKRTFRFGTIVNEPEIVHQSSSLMRYIQTPDTSVTRNMW